jgi:hypothetical protein
MSYVFLKCFCPHFCSVFKLYIMFGYVYDYMSLKEDLTLP